MKRPVTLLATALLFSIGAGAQFISTIAGNNNGDPTANGIPALNAKLLNPWAIAVDDAGNVYVSEPEKCVIRKIDASGTITTVAGTGTPGYSGDRGPATNAQLNLPYGIAADHSGRLFIADHDNNVIRMVSADGIITTVVGTGDQGYTGDGQAASTATLGNPFDVALDAVGNMYIADAFYMAVRKVGTDGIISTVINGFSSTLSGGIDGYTGDLWYPSNARLSGLAVDQGGNVYIADYWDNIIRRVTPSGIMTTIGGDKNLITFGGNGVPALTIGLAGPKRIVVDDTGNVIFSENGNGAIRKINPAGIITTIVGNASTGKNLDNVPVLAAGLSGPVGIALYSGDLYIVDNGNGIVRRVNKTGVGVKPIAAADKIMLQPNPGKGTFSVKGTWDGASNESVALSVIDMSGRVVYKNTVTLQNGVMDTQLVLNAAAGSYLLKMATADKTNTLRFMIEE